MAPGDPGATLSDTPLVWYVAYGSNMDPERLACYLAGGRPPGALRTYVGARDPSPPRVSRPVRIPHRVFFAGVSRVWGGGGVAFVDPLRCGAGTTPGVAHLLTVEQLADLAAQENGSEAPGDALTALPGAGDHVELGSGRYDLLVGLAPIDGVAAVVLTTASPPPTNGPSPAYSTMLRRGRSRWWPESRPT